MYPETSKLITQQLKTGLYPGVAFAFIKQGKVEASYQGEAQIIPFHRPILKDTLFDVASLTKMICTNSVVLHLIEQEKLLLDMPLKKYLPSIKDEKVTCRHLLTHTSDINPYIKNRDTLNAPELKKALLLLSTGNDIGKKVKYTDTGTLLLGFMIEELYQSDLHTVFLEKVLTPLGMNQSCFKPDNSKAAATEKHATRGIICGEVHDPKAFVLGKHCGSAGLFATLEDCIRYTEMLLNKGVDRNGNTFLQESTVLSLLQDWTPDRKLNRSLGWDLKNDTQDNHLILFHTGYTGTFLLIDILSQEAFIFLSNRVHPYDNRQFYLQERDKLVDIYLKEKALSV